MNTDIARVMQTVLLTGHGGLDKLEYREDGPVPQPARGEVLIEISRHASFPERVT